MAPFTPSQLSHRRHHINLQQSGFQLRPRLDKSHLMKLKKEQLHKMK